MKKAIMALVTLAFVSAASASCPTSQPYGCHPTFGGKMQCGCGQ